MTREGVPLAVIQRQPGHAHLSVIISYRPVIDTEIINAIRAAADDLRQRQPQTLTNHAIRGGGAETRLPVFDPSSMLRGTPRAAGAPLW
jgi:hypothetical protein